VPTTRPGNDRSASAGVAENRAELRLIVSDLESAAPSIDRATAIAKQRKDRAREAAALKLRGALQRLLGFPVAAIDTLRHALTLSAVGQDASLGAELLYQYGAALSDGGDVERARDVWHTSMEAFEHINARQWVGRLRKRLSEGGNHRYF
jgi:tetratricopeptide (TPR) repeat protein